MLPKLPKPQNTAARVPSSDCLYQEPYMKCAPTLQACVSSYQNVSGREDRWSHILGNCGKRPLEAIENEDLPHVIDPKGYEG